MSKDPSISVVVPLYNKADYVVRTLWSAFEQLSSFQEIIVVDDGSTDGGADIVESEFPEVLVIRQANSGEATARNIGVRHSSSEWVAFLDADDLWHPDHLQELRFLIRKYPDVHMVATAYHVLPPPRRIVPRLPRFPRRRRANILRLTRNHLGAFWTSALAVKRETLEGEGGFSRHGFGADIDTWLKLGVRHRCAYSSRPTATYITGNPGVMQSQVQVAAEKERDGWIIESVTDLPGLSYVLEAASDSKSWVTKSVARRYRNGRVCQALKIAIRNDLPRQAAVLSGFFQRPLGLRSGIYLCLARMNPGARRKLVKLWLQIFRYRWQE